MANEVVFEEQVQIRDVFRLPGNVTDARCRDRDRLGGQDIVHDRQIVNGEIPDDADVVLEQAQVYADRVVVIHIPKAVVDELAHLSDRTGVHERVINREHQLATFSFIDESLRLFSGRRNWFFNKHMLPGLQRAQREIEVTRHGRRDGDGVDARIVQDIAEVRGNLNSRVPALHPGETICLEVAHGHQPHPRRLPEVSNEVRTPVPVACDRNANHLLLLKECCS